MKKPTYKHEKTVNSLLALSMGIVLATSFLRIDFGWKLLSYTPFVICAVYIARQSYRQRCWASGTLILAAALLITLGQAAVMYHWLPL